MSKIIHTPNSLDGTPEPADNLIIETPRSKKSLPVDVTIFPLSNFVAFPHMILPIVVPQGDLQNIIQEQSKKKNDYIGFIARKKGSAENPTPSELFEVGVCARILRVLKLPDGSSSMIVQTLKRFRVIKYSKSVPAIEAHVEYLEQELGDEKKLAALTSSAQDLLQQVIQLSPTLSDEFSLAALNIEGPKKVSDFVAAHLKRIDIATRQEILETLSVEKRLEKCIYHLSQELEILKLGQKIQGEIQDKVVTHQREFLLREQLKAIQKELGEDRDDLSADIKKLKDKLAAAKLSKEAQEKATEELRRLENMPTESSEYSITRNYLDWLGSLPWEKTTEDIQNLKAASAVLERDHFGLKDVKDRILEFLAVKTLKKDLSGSIICFVGPPGVGKTSLGKSIADSLGRNFHRLSLGGMRDEAEIKGHRRTYVGSMPGRLIQALKRVQSKNPVILLDEIDKVGSDWRGDPASALLEVLDPEQNKSFMDYYLDLPFDLSKVLFICTANTVDTIPSALRDRLEIIRMPGYIESEKVAIAQKYLLPKQIKEAGLTTKNLSLTKRAILDIIRYHTREAGVRNLERTISKVCRKVATRVVKGNKSAVKLDGPQLSKFLGPEKFSPDSLIPRKPGVVMGLAWTNYGGEVMFIEATKMPGSKNLELTGKLGGTMKESARIALSFVRSLASKYDFELKDFDKTDIHIHFPAGAVPKDGPSAGIAIASSLISLFKKKPLKARVAMTGELSLVGQVLPIGGLKEKIIAARQFKCREVIIPFENKKDMVEIPTEVTKGIKFHFVKTYDDVYKVIF